MAIKFSSNPPGVSQMPFIAGIYKLITGIYTLGKRRHELYQAILKLCKKSVGANDCA
jgi:hypothetical protein